MINIKNKSLVVAITVIVVLLLAGAGFWYWRTNQPIQRVACTMEAKLCPDGSYVGRTGLNCEFAPCPNIINSSSSSVLGEDKDGNGVWDDIQVYIDKIASSSQKIKAALYQYAKVEQNFMLQAGDKGAANKNAELLARATACFFYVGPDSYEILLNLIAEMKNNESRTMAALEAQSQLDGQIVGKFDFNASKSQCDFNPDEMKN